VQISNNEGGCKKKAQNERKDSGDLGRIHKGAHPPKGGPGRR